MTTTKGHTPEGSFPMRINKYLAFTKQYARREADRLIEKRLVYLNGKVAALGAKVALTDVVEVRGAKRTYRYCAYNKPQGIITHSPQGKEVSITQSTKLLGLFPVGRLDKDSCGLIILSDDGRVTDALLNPKYEHQKEYVVTCRGALPPRFKQRMEAGVDIEGYKTRKCRVALLSEKTFSIVLTEGKKHQIRRMCSALGQTVQELKRIRIMNIKLGNLAPGAYRDVVGVELSTFLHSIGLKK